MLQAVCSGGNVYPLPGYWTPDTHIAPLPCLVYEGLPLCQSATCINRVLIVLSQRVLERRAVRICSRTSKEAATPRRAVLAIKATYARSTRSFPIAVLIGFVFVSDVPMAFVRICSTVDHVHSQTATSKHLTTLIFAIIYFLVRLLSIPRDVLFDCGFQIIAAGIALLNELWLSRLVASLWAVQQFIVIGRQVRPSVSFLSKTDVCRQRQ